MRKSGSEVREFDFTLLGVEYVNHPLFGQCKIISTKEITRNVKWKESLMNTDDPYSAYNFYFHDSLQEYAAVRKGGIL